MSNVLGQKIQFEIFGESHGPCIGGVLSGLPSGVAIDLSMLEKNLAKRRPGSSEYVTSRVELDQVEFLSGLLEGVTTGAPLAFIIRNTNQHSADYLAIGQLPRPSHADYPAYVRYHGMNDVRGGGHFSGRLTASVVVAGSIAEQLNRDAGIRVYSHLKTVGPISDLSYFDSIDESDYVASESRTFQTINPELNTVIENYIKNLKELQDSAGGQVETVVFGLPAGIGNPFFGSVESRLASALYSIPGVKGLEFGRGFDIVKLQGSQANDPLHIRDEGIVFEKNDSGGINGGISNGAPIVFNLAFRPTASIALPQDTVNLKEKKNQKFSIEGRHDPAFVLRTPVVVKAMTHLVLLEMRLNP
jgi:chorismate synthase